MLTSTNVDECCLLRWWLIAPISWRLHLKTSEIDKIFQEISLASKARSQSTVEMVLSYH